MRSSLYTASPETYSHDAMLTRAELAAWSALRSPTELARRASDVAAWQPPKLEPGSISGRDHYATGIYSQSQLQDHAQWVVQKLREIPHDFVAVTGKSGMAVAFAALALEQFNLVTIRKGESTHGDMIEGTADRLDRYVFLDDFVSSGSTRDRVQSELDKYADGWKYARPRRVAQLLYARRSVKTE